MVELCRGLVVLARPTLAAINRDGRTAVVHGDHAIAIERLRAARGLPRWVYIRPSLAVLRRSSTYGRDKDVKPLCVDLENYAFMSIFLKRLAKYEELEVVEMLPGPDQLPWRDADGRRTFELRAIVQRES